MLCLDDPFLTAYCAAVTAILGACMGSFLNCMAWRLVHGESVLRGRSHCDACGHVLGAGDLIPIVSYVVHRGRCRYCGAKLSRVHLLAELISMLVYVSIFFKFYISLQALKALIFVSLLLASAFADLEGYIIPDRFIVAGIVVSMGSLLFAQEPLAALQDALLGAFVVAGTILALVLLFEKIKGVEAMGGGDIKLLFMTGTFLGLAANIVCLLLSCLIGIFWGLAATVGKEEKTFPWGPSIAIGAWLALLFGNELAAWYLGLLA